MGRLRLHSKLISTVVLAFFAMGMVGAIPNLAVLVRWMFAHTPASTLVEAYPCQGGACGCSSADECFEACCCNSVEQLLAFAIEHDLDRRVAQLAPLAPDIDLADPADEPACDLCETEASPRIEADPAGVPACGTGSCGSDGADGTASNPITLTIRFMDAMRCKQLSMLLALGVAPMVHAQLPAVEPMREASHPLLQVLSTTTCAARDLDIAAPPPRST